jgi:hypothetical protein
MFENPFKKKEITPIPEGVREEAETENALRDNVSEMTENYDLGVDRSEPVMGVEEKTAEDLELASQVEGQIDQGTVVGEKINKKNALTDEAMTGDDIKGFEKEDRAV